MKSNQLKRALRTVVVLSMAFLLSSCEKNKGGGGKNGSETEGDHKVVVLDQKERPSVKEIKPDGTVVFMGTDMVGKLSPGTIICSEPADNAPYGFLYKVKSVRTEGGSTFVQTEFAAFEEAVEEGSVSETVDLLAHVTSIRDWNGNPVEIPNTRTDVNSSLKLPLEVHIPKPKNAGNITADFYLKGSLDLKVAFHIDLDIKKFKCQLFELWAQPECEFSLTLGSNIKGKVEFERFRLYEMDLEPITIPVAGIPLVIVPKLCIDVTPSAEGTISLDAKLVDLDFRYKGGVKYTKQSGWEKIDENTSKEPVLFNELAKIEMEGKLTVPPSITIIPAFYGLSSEDAEAGVDSGIPFTLKVSDFDFEDFVEGYMNPKVKFTWGIEAGAHAKLKILGYDLIDFKPKATLAEWVIVDKHMFPKFSKMTVDEFEPGKARLTFIMEDLDDCLFSVNSDHGVYWVLGEWIRNVENTNAQKISLGYVDLKKVGQQSGGNTSWDDYGRHYTFSVEVDGIRPNTLYTVRPFVDNILHIQRGDANVFISSNQVYNPLKVHTLPVEQFVSTAATLRGQFETDGSVAIIEKGFCISDTETVPSLDNARIVILESNVNQCDVNDLKPSTKYYVRAFARSALGSVYGEVVDFTTSKAVSTLIDVTPNELNFGEVLIGSSASQKVTITNTGTGVLKFSLAGAGNCYTFSPSAEVSLDSGKSCEVTVSFTPSKTGQFGSTLQVLSNAANGTKTIQCHGVGIDASSIQTETITVKGVSFKMVKIDAGSFMMGSPDDDPDAGGIYSDEKPQHRVSLSSYAIGETEVTQALWKAVMGNNPSRITGDDRPVEEVSWDEAQSFVSRLSQLTGRSFRLPTEAEWEYAARGGKYSKGYKYAGSNDVFEVSWNCENCDATTHPVATKKPNELGLYDMSGNVWEWCQDWYDFGYYKNSPSENPCNMVASDYHIHRGGSIEYVLTDLRIAMRGDYVNPPSNSMRGLRLVISSISQSSISVPQAVDLGLSVKWASFNLGASKPEECGDYYAWGETEPYYSSLDPLTWKPGKEGGYNWPSYKWCMGSSDTQTKYCTDSGYGYNGFTDGKTVLDPEDDAAHVNLGGKWRMPTKAEQDELREKCSWEWIQVNGVFGFKVIGPNGNSIFLPAAGYSRDTNLNYDGSDGYYWSSSLDKFKPSEESFLYFNSMFVIWTIRPRCYGLTIRPVCD